MSRSIPSRPMLVCLVLATLAGTVHAQNALGDGTALDANTGQYGPRNYQRPNLANEISFRNAIATGNAPGGISFRGDLGYRAAGEFTGELGSDALFAFRRDSLYSGLAGMGIRGTDALQYQFALTTGAAPPRNLMGNLSIARDDYYPSSTGFGDQTQRSRAQTTGSVIGIDQESSDLDLRGRQLQVPMPGAGESSLSEMGSMLGTLRSSSSYSTTANLQPALMSVYPEGIDRRPIGLIASPLLGITSTPMFQKDKQANPLVSRPPNAGGNDLASTSSPQSARLETSYDGLVNQMREHVQELREKSSANGTQPTTIKRDESNDEWLVRQMQELREKLYGDKPANDGATKNTDPNQTDPNAPASPSTDQTDEAASASSQIPPISIPNDPNSPLNKAIAARQMFNADPTRVELYDPTAIAIDPETLEVLRGSAAKEVEQLLDPGALNRDIYAEHITVGQRLMSEGRYFDAEERFTHALSIKPGDVPAQLGRLHAQIGAGMVLSASINLQSIFSQHPEVIASRYAGSLLPDRARVQSIIDRLNERTGFTSPKRSTRNMEGTQIRVSSAYLLGYLGYQINDEDTAVKGLALVKELGSDTDRRIASLLAQVWLGRDIPASQGTP